MIYLITIFFYHDFKSYNLNKPLEYKRTWLKTHLAQNYLTTLVTCSNKGKKICNKCIIILNSYYIPQPHLTPIHYHVHGNAQEVPLTWEFMQLVKEVCPKSKASLLCACELGPFS